MTDAVLLSKIKTGLGISGDYHNDTLQIYIDDVKSFMLDAGVPQSIVNSAVSVGCILQGVNDLWNYSSGGAKLSEYFKQKVIQLAANKYTLDKPLAEIRVDIPTAEEAELYGWHSTGMGAALNITSGEFTVTDDQLIKGTVYYPDGTEASAENSTTGNRRRLQFGTRNMTVMPNSIYDTAQSRFVDRDGVTAFNVPSGLQGATLVLSTYYKEV